MPGPGLYGNKKMASAKMTKIKSLAKKLAHKKIQKARLR